MHDCCKRHIEFDREEGGKKIFRCTICQEEFEVKER